MAATAVSGTRSAATVSHIAAVGGAALLLGVAGDVLFKGVGLGLNVFFWVAGCSAWATFLSGRYGEVRAAPDWWQLPAVLSAAAFALRADPVLRLLDGAALCVALALPVLRARGTDPWRAGASAYSRATLWLAGQIAAGAAILLSEMRWEVVGGLVVTRYARRMLAGLVIAAPLMLVFGLLFGSADPVFGAAVASLTQLDLGSLPAHVALVVLFGAVAAGFLRARLWGARSDRAITADATRAVDTLPILVAVTSMAGMFLLFVALQARALVGGAAFVQGTTGLTLAEYARTGFFQCLWAAGLSLPVLYTADVLVGSSSARGNLRALATLQLLLVGAVLASAAVRLDLYIGAFGLTMSRVFGVAGLAWVVLVGAWFWRTVLRGRRRGFVFGSLVAGFVTLVVLNLVNPAAVVVEVNLARAAQGATLDANYLTSLGQDAAPAIAEALPSLPRGQACALAAGLLDAQDVPRERRDLRDWTWSRWRANAAADVAAALRCWN